MLVDEDYRRVIGFITSDKIWNDRLKRYKRTPVATVFFLAMPHGFDKRESSGFTVYAITTKHSILPYKPDEKINIRVNMEKGGYKDIETKANDWIPNPVTDVAVCIMPSDRFTDCIVDWFQYDVIAPYSQTAYSGFAAGDSVFSVGLFEGFSGNNEIMPIARFGKISLMPHESEKIDAEIVRDTYTPITAYLAEMTSWEGQSGSPVFVYFQEGRYDCLEFEEQTAPRVERNEPTLIGLVQGFFDVQGQKINSGIMIVVPAQDIINTLMEDELVRDRQQAKEQKTEPRFKPKASSIETEKPLTKADFENALKKASQKTSEPES